VEFKTEISVKGKSIQGNIRNGKFYLVLLEQTSEFKPPLRSVEVDKMWIDAAIEELKQVREKM
jgi:hypothetical protein